MEIEEETFAESPPADVASVRKTASCAADVLANSPLENPSFDCNICLDFTADPVVTLCGHLYCWHCIYCWLHPTSNDRPLQCPVCKFPISESSLVPLYGCGRADKTHGRQPGIPDRPRDSRGLVAVHQRPQALGSENYHFCIDGLENRWGVLNSTVGMVLGELAFAMLPWACTTPPNSYLSHNVGENPRRRRQEMRMESCLKHLWIFLLCSAVLCLLCF